MDSPLKRLIREEGGGMVLNTWNTGAYCADRHGVPDDMRRVIDSGREVASAIASRR